jgi:hypothetical protein
MSSSPVLLSLGGYVIDFRDRWTCQTQDHDCQMAQKKLTVCFCVSHADPGWGYCIDFFCWSQEDSDGEEWPP